MVRGKVTSFDVRMIVLRLSSLHGPTEISRILGLNVTTVRRIIKLFNDTGNIMPPPGAKKGRKAKLTEHDRLVSTYQIVH
jgi:transposase